MMQKENAAAITAHRAPRQECGHYNTGCLDLLLSRLDKVKKSQAGYMACCPAHQDKNPSLSIKQASDGKVLLHCFAGCEAEDIVTAIGLNISDLFPESGLTKTQRQQYRKQKRLATAQHLIDAELAIVKIARNRQAGGETLNTTNQARLETALARLAALGVTP